MPTKLHFQLYLNTNLSLDYRTKPLTRSSAFGEISTAGECILSWIPGYKPILYLHNTSPLNSKRDTKRGEPMYEHFLQVASTAGQSSANTGRLENAQLRLKTTIEGISPQELRYGWGANFTVVNDNEAKATNRSSRRHTKTGQTPKFA